MPDSNYSSQYKFMPPQKLADSEKNSEWGEQCVNAIAGMMGQQKSGDRKTALEMQINYDLINGKSDPADIQHVINPTNIDATDQEQLGGLPASFQHHDIISAKLNELEGEEIRRPFNFRAYGTSGGVLSRQKEKRNELVLAGLQRLLLESLGQDADPEQVPLEEVEAYFKSKYKDPAEVGANQILKALIPKLKLQMKFNRGFRHVLAVAEELYHVGLVNGEPSVRACNPPNCSFDKDPDLEFVEDGQWFCERRFMTNGSVLDEFRGFLKDADVKKIDQRTEGLSVHSGHVPGYIYSPGDADAYNNAYQLGVNPGSNSLGTSRYGSQHLIEVVRVCWKSMREIGFLTYVDEHGEEQEQLVDPQQVKLTPAMKKQGMRLERQWITDVWEGTRIGADIYVNIRPLDNQTGKLPYVGYVYSNINSKATSLVDRVKSTQYLYNVVWYRLESELAKAKGKSVVIDVAQMPRTGEFAMTMDQWLYYKETLGIVFINSAEEGREGDPNSLSKFNQWNSLDQTISNNVGQYIMIINKLESRVGDIMGVSRQREGNITSNETVGGVEKAINQSNNITEGIFYYHNIVKENVLTQLVQVAKLAYMDGTHGQYIVDDVYREWLNIEGGLLNDTEFAVFIRDSSKDAATMQKLEMYADRALQAGEARLSAIINSIDTDSVSEIKGILLQSEEEADKRKSEQQQSQQAMQTEQLEAQQAEKDADREFVAEQKALDRENDIRKSYISATKGAGGDANANGVSDGMELLALAGEDQKNYLARLKMETDAMLKQKEATRKEAADVAKQQESQIKLQVATRNQDIAVAKFQAELEHKNQLRKDNALEQAQQNRMHADKVKYDRELLKLKNAELKIKAKQVNKPKK